MIDIFACSSNLLANFPTQLEPLFATAPVPCTLLPSGTLPIASAVENDEAPISTEEEQRPSVVSALLSEARGHLDSRAFARLYQSVVELMTLALSVDKGGQEGLSGEQRTAVLDFAVLTYTRLPTEMQRQLKLTAHYRCRGGKGASPQLPSETARSALQAVFRQVAAGGGGDDKSKSAAVAPASDSALAAVGAWAALAPADTLAWYAAKSDYRSWRVDEQ